MGAVSQTGSKGSARTVIIRRALATDLPAITKLDEKATGRSKPDYWKRLYEHFSQASGETRAFLVASVDDRVVGFMTGEVRAFEFGSDPCGWVFALTVDSHLRVQNIGTLLFEAICEIFNQAGVDKVRTMIGRDNHLVLAFFRSLGMMAGPFIQLERDLE